MAKKFSGLVSQIQKNSFSDIESTQNEKKTKELVILEELKVFIPPLTFEELERLEASILQDGCRDELVAWERNPQEYILVDGHNRYGICKKHNIPYAVLVRPFEDMEEVKDFMINNQLGKRNVTEEVKSYFRGLQYSKMKKTHGDSQRFGLRGQNVLLDKNAQNNTNIQDEYLDKKYENDLRGQNVLLDKNLQNDTQKGGLKTYEKLAQEHKVSVKTIQRDENFVQNLDKFSGENMQLKWGILNKNILISKSDLEKIVKFSDEEIEKIREDFLNTNELIFPKKETNSKQKNIQNSSNNFEKIFNKDFKNLLKKLENSLLKNQKEKAKEIIKEIENKLL